MEGKIITLCNTGFSRAIIIKSMLDAENISCFLTNINSIHPATDSGVRIRIREEDFNRAWELLESLDQESNENKRFRIENLKKIRRILVPIDFTTYSLNACKYALELAPRMKAEITLFYAVTDPLLFTEPYSGITYINDISSMPGKGRESDIKHRMEQWIREMKILHIRESGQDTKIKHAIGHGNVVDAIQGYAEEYKPGIVIMGTHGIFGEDALYTGRITYNLIGKMETPLLIIPQNAAYKGIDYIHRILYATDFDESDFKSISSLIAILQPFQVEIHCVHIANTLDHPWNEVKMKELKEFIQSEFSTYKLICNVLEDYNAPQRIEEYAHANEIDLIAMTVRKRSLLERVFYPSITKKMFLHSYVPLLIFNS